MTDSDQELIPRLGKTRLPLFLWIGTMATLLAVAGYLSIRSGSPNSSQGLWSTPGILGIVRVNIWLIGAGWSFRLKRILGTLSFFGLAVLTFINTMRVTGVFDNPHKVDLILAFCATPTAALVVATFVMAPIDLHLAKKWHL